MVYEKKALGAIDKILDAIVYEEGRLSVINKYGTALNDEEKVQATQLITAQRENLDRLFEIYKNELEPIMSKIDATGHSMQPFVEKLLAAEMIAKRMIFEQEVAAAKENNAAVSNDAPVITGTVPTEETAAVEESSAGTFIPADTTVVNDTPGVEATGDAVVTESTPVETPVAEMTGEAAVVSDAPAAEVTSDVVAESAPTETAVVETAGEAAVVNDTPAAEVTSDVVTESAPTETAVAETTGEGAVVNDTPAAEVTSDVVADSTPTETPVTETTGEAAVANDTPAESTPAAFVLSPIDEDVAPAASAEEVKAAEETVAAADQQLQTIDNMKTDITSDPNLTEEEKKDKLEQYTRMTDATVRAILVTKVQAEKLLASREAQKALLTKGNEVKAEEATDAAIPAVSEGDAPATEGAKTEEAVESAVVLPTIGATDTSSESAAPAVTEEAAASEVVLPMIGGESAPSDVAPTEQTAPADENALSNVVLEIPGAAPAEQPAPADAQNNSELQTMIEQANALYKEGKVDEAKAMFEKIGAMNQAGQGAGEAEAANVLVKK